VTPPGFSPDTLFYQSSLGQFLRLKGSRTTALRQEQAQARSILAKRQAYLQEQQAAALPKSPLGAAIGYALRLGRPDALRRRLTAQDRQ
jgi:hypothetical protein